MSSVFDGYNDHFLAEARLVILKGLHEEDDYTLSDSLMQAKLKSFAINKGRTFVRNQLQWLEREVQAVKVTVAGSALIAELTENGVSHVERSLVLDGVKKPSAIRG